MERNQNRGRWDNRSDYFPPLLERAHAESENSYYDDMDKHDNSFRQVSLRSRVRRNVNRSSDRKTPGLVIEILTRPRTKHWKPGQQRYNTRTILGAYISSLQKSPTPSKVQLKYRHHSKDGSRRQQKVLHILDAYCPYLNSATIIPETEGNLPLPTVHMYKAYADLALIHKYEEKSHKHTEDGPANSAPFASKQNFRSKDKARDHTLDKRKHVSASKCSSSVEKGRKRVGHASALVIARLQNPRRIIKKSQENTSLQSPTETKNQHRVMESKKIRSPQYRFSIVSRTGVNDIAPHNSLLVAAPEAASHIASSVDTLQIAPTSNKAGTKAQAQAQSEAVESSSNVLIGAEIHTTEVPLSQPKVAEEGEEEGKQAAGSRSPVTGVTVLQSVGIRDRVRRLLRRNNDRQRPRPNQLHEERKSNASTIIADDNGIINILEVDRLSTDEEGYR